MPDHRLRQIFETPAGKTRANVQVNVLVEGEIALVIAPDLGEQLPPQQAGSAAYAEYLPALQVLGPLRLASALLNRATVSRQRLAGAVDGGASTAACPP